MRPNDPQETEIIQESLHLSQEFLQLYGLNDNVLIDVLRMVNAAIYGFLTSEQLELMTLDRSSDLSDEVMLEALLVAIAHIQSRSSDESFA